MNHSKPSVYWIIDNLNIKYAPNEKMQILICDDNVEPPSSYQYYPAVCDGCEIAAQLNITRIKKKLNINKMFIFYKDDRDSLIKNLLYNINNYAASKRYRYIYTTPTQYRENNLGDYGFTYYEKYNLYRRKVVRRK